MLTIFDCLWVHKEGGAVSSDRYEQICYADMIRALNELHYAGETQFYGTAGLRPCEKALYARYGGSASRILDVGCGAGRVTRSLAARGADITGVDVNLRALRAAHQLAPAVKLVHGSMGKLPFADRSFDQVWCLRFSFNALPTTKERTDAIREMWRLCAPNGHVILEVFNWHFPGRLGLLRAANLLDVLLRRLRWVGQGRSGSLPLPPRDILYLANKWPAAAPGYAHLTSVRELEGLIVDAGVRADIVFTNQEGIVSGRLRPVRPRHRSYATWLLLRKREQS